ncbi:MAG TPA: thioesterase, partial [Mycobacteriales bacterium]
MDTVDQAAGQDVLGGYVRWLGLDFLEADADHVVAAWDVRHDQLQPYGIVHGGVHCSVIETLASTGAAHWFGERGQVVG